MPRFIAIAWGANEELQHVHCGRESAADEPVPAPPPPPPSKLSDFPTQCDDAADDDDESTYPSMHSPASQRLAFSSFQVLTNLFLTAQPGQPLPRADSYDAITQYINSVEKAAAMLPVDDDGLPVWRHSPRHQRDDATLSNLPACAISLGGGRRGPEARHRRDGPGARPGFLLREGGALLPPQTQTQMNPPAWVVCVSWCSLTWRSGGARRRARGQTSPPPSASGTRATPRSAGYTASATPTRRRS